MIHILIVDDEPLIRKSIHLMLENHYSGQNLQIAEASDGFKALEYTSSMETDIILTDIKMPGCSGLELMERLNELEYNGKIIVLSGFDDYSLVRNAMKLGATDYLLKPIVEEEFLSLMDNSFREILHRKSYLTRHQDERVIDIRKLYENQYNLDELLAEHFDLPGLPSPESNAILLLIDLSKQEKIHLDYVKSTYFKQCNEYFLPHLAEKHLMLQGESRGYWIVLLCNASEQDYYFVQPFLAGCTNREQKACCSKLFVLAALQNAFGDCVNRMDHIFYNIPKLPPNQLEDFPYTKHFDQMEETACRFSYADFSTALHDLFLQINYEKRPVTEIKKLLLDSMYRIMQKNTRYIRIIGQYKMSPNDVILRINDAFSLSSLQTDLLSIFQIYMEQEVSSGQTSESSYLRKAKDYVNRMYDKEISLTDIAGYLNLHPNYFSALFKKDCGMTFMEYLRKVRIEKACALMKQSNRKLYEIAEQVGYRDALQFNRAFHKETGVSPSEYLRKL